MVKKKGEEVKGEELLAMKKITVVDSSRNTYGVSKEAIREIKHLQELDHPHILKVHHFIIIFFFFFIFSSSSLQMFDVFSYEGSIHVILEYCLSDLEKIIKKPKVVLLPGDVKNYMQQILQAVDYCHRNWVMHRVPSPLPSHSIHPSIYLHPLTPPIC